MKIAFDENISPAMVRVFQTFADERQLQKLVGGKFEIKSAKDYTPQPGDPDYLRKNDVPWLKRFAADGGKVVISDNRDMKRVPHERLALVELGLVVFFFENQWSGWRFFRKCSLLLHWWPEIAAKITSKRTKPGTFWHIPSNWPEKGKLKAVSNQDPKLLKIEQQKAAGGRKKKPPKAPIQTSDGPLFEFVRAKRPKKEPPNVPQGEASPDSAKTEGDPTSPQGGGG